MAIRVPQVKQRGLPTTTGVRTPNAEAFGFGVGTATRQAGQALGDITLDIQRRENVAKTREVDTIYKQRMNDLKAGYQQKNGKDAYESQQDYDAAVDALREEAMEMLDNDAQRTMFEPSANAELVGAKAFGTSHATKSFMQWEVQELEGQLTIHSQEAAATYGTPAGKVRLAQAMQNLEDLADKKGWPPEKLEAEQAKAHSTIVRQKIHSMLEADPFGAQRLFEETDKLSLADRNALEKAVVAYTEKARVHTTADTLIKVAGTEGWDTAYEMTKEIEDIEQRSQVQKYLDFERRRQQDVQDQAQRDLHEAEWNKLLDLGREPTMHDLPAPGVVDPKVYMSMQSYVQSRAKGANRTDPDFAKDLSTMAHGDDQNEFLELDLDQHRHQLSDRDYDKWSKLQADLKNGDESTVKTRTTQTQMYRRAERAAGIKNPRSDEAYELQQAIDLAVEEAETAKGGKLNPTEQKAIIGSEVYQHRTMILESGTGMRGFFMDETRLDQRTFTTSTGERWPDDVVEQVVRDMEEDGQELTTDNVNAQLKALEGKHRR